MFARVLGLSISAFLFIVMAVMGSHAQATEVQLAWDPPTAANGSPLQNLAGYRIYWGPSSKSYEQTKEVSKSVTSTTITNLSEGKTYYFAVTTLDTTKNESDYSNEVSVTIPLPSTPAPGTPQDPTEPLPPTPAPGTPQDPTEPRTPAPAPGTPQVRPVEAVSASAWEEPNVPANTQDGNLGTRWSAKGDGQWIMYDLGSPMTLSQVAIAWHQGNTRQSFFAIEVSANGTDWIDVYSGESSGTTLELEPYSFAAVPARYVRIVGYGNATNLWNSITEVELYGPQDTGPLPEVLLPVQAVSASAWQAPNVPANTQDGALNTRWSAEGDGQWIMYDLGSPLTLSQVAIAWYQGNTRQSFFAIEVSANSTDWTVVYSGESSGTTLELEPYVFMAVSARYMRIVGSGNTAGRWNSITEVELYGPQDTGPLPEVLLPVQAVSASAWQAPNVPANTQDGALNTRWSAEGKGQWLVYDLGSPLTLSQVAIAWYQGNTRQSFFTIEVSANSTDWTVVHSGESSGTTLELEPYSFAAVPARYVRIVGAGTTAGRWNSITEVELYGW